MYQSAHEIWSAQLHQFQRYDWGKFKKRVMRPWPRPLGSSLSVIKSQTLDIFYLHTKFGDCGSSRSGDIIADVCRLLAPNVLLIILHVGLRFVIVNPYLYKYMMVWWWRYWIMGHVTLTTPLYGWFVILRLGNDIVYLCTKFDDSSFSQSRDVIGDASRDPDHAPFKDDWSSI